jgi:hypothetical protein
VGCILGYAGTTRPLPSLVLRRVRGMKFIHDVLPSSIVVSGKIGYMGEREWPPGVRCRHEVDDNSSARITLWSQCPHCDGPTCLEAAPSRALLSSTATAFPVFPRQRLRRIDPSSHPATLETRSCSFSSRWPSVPPERPQPRGQQECVLAHSHCAEHSLCGSSTTTFYWFKPVQHRMAAISIREAMPIQRANALESRKASWPQGVKHSKTKDEAGRT